MPLKKGKHIEKRDYTKEKVEKAVERAKNLDVERSRFLGIEERWPSDIGSTVYKLLEKIIKANN